jgi:hypothetical protein
MADVSSAAWPVNQIGVATQGDAVADVAALTSSAPAAVTAAADAPAGGTGAAAGGWDTAGHRDTAITTINQLRADVIALRATLLATQADVAACRTTLLALQDSLQAAAIIAA